MTEKNKISMRVHLFLFCLSSSLIAYQIILMQFLSIVQWHHFAYMIISFALLGFGTAGTIISIFRNYLIRNYIRLMPAFALLCGIMMIIAPVLSQFKIIRFDSYLLFSNIGHIKELLFTYILFTLPFLSGALSIGLIFTKYNERIGSIYFSNLLGSAFGGIIAIIALWLASPEKISLYVSLPAILACLIIIEYRMPRHLTAAILIVICISINLFIKYPELHPSEYKGISGGLRVPGSKIIYEKNSPHGNLQIVENPVQRYALGISLNFSGEVPRAEGIYVNGDWYGPLFSISDLQDSKVFNFATYELPYLIQDIKNLLILNAGNGPHLYHSLIKKNVYITAVEPHPILAGIINNTFKTNEIHSKRLRIFNIDNRQFLISDKKKYDLIVMPIIGTLGGSSGLSALKEDYLLTAESFENIWRHLSKNGIISITSWIDNPVRNSYRILALVKKTLKANRIMEPEKHIVAVRNWSAVSFFVKASKFSFKDIQTAKYFCKKMSFDIVMPLESALNQFDTVNEPPDNAYLKNIAAIFSGYENEFYKNYTFNIEPPTDNKPYFFQFIKIKKIKELLNIFSKRDILFLEIGYLLVFITLIQAIIISFLLILLPLFKTGFRLKNKLIILLYFSGIAVGYMFIEILLIQKFILYVGNPVYASSIVIGFLLLSSGIGSIFSNKIGMNEIKKIIAVFIGLIILIAVYVPILDWLIRISIEFPDPVKFILSIFFIAPLGFLMGVPFPLGIRLLRIKDEKSIPWAWGINGLFSVVSSVLAIIIAVEYGFSFLFMLAALPYLISLFALKELSFLNRV